MAKILTIGSATQDIFLMIEGADTMRLQSNNALKTYMLFPQGAKIDVPVLHTAVGGGATNAAVGLSRLGHTVQTYFCVGDDPAGALIKKQMLKEAIAIDLVKTIPDGHTASSFIIPSCEKNHVVFVHRGVNKQLSAKYFPLEALSELDYLFIGPLSGTGTKLFPLLAPEAKKRGVMVVANPGMGQLSHDPFSFINQLPSIDCLILNAREAAMLLHSLTGISADVSYQSKRLCTLPLSDSPTCPSCKPASEQHAMPCFIVQYMKELIRRGPSLLVVTNGIEGVYVATKDLLYFHPTLHVESVSALGAGDAFSSGFIGALAHRKPLEEAIVCGVINASSVIQSLDAQTGLLSLEEIGKRFEKQGLAALKSYDMQNT
jgi:sugar/nucleoside kinase (ribokinase family)